MSQLHKCSYTFLLLIYLLTTISCNQSELSTQKVEDISAIGATIKVYQSPFAKNENSVVVELFDQKRKRISNDSLILYINTIEVTLTRRQGLYYFDESYYSAENVSVNNTFNVKIKLSDGKVHHLGTVKVLQQQSPEDIVCEEKGDLNKNTMVKWANLKEINELSISPSERLLASEDNVTSYGYRQEVVKKISGNGSYIYFKNDYTNSKSTISTLEFTFRTTKTGQINPKLLDKSSITVSTSITKSVSF